MGEWQWLFDVAQRLHRAILAFFGQSQVQLRPVPVVRNSRPTHLRVSSRRQQF
jgi:hypothetical protein